VTIRFDRVIPFNISPAQAGQSEVWDAELSLEPGSRVLINAPSGSGKTTFIHLLYGLRRTFQGRYSLGSRDTQSLQRRDWAEIRQAHLAVVFQDLRLFPAATGMENIRIKAELRPVLNETAIRDMARRLGMLDRLDRPVQTLSQGERQRIAIIRALCQPFDWILLDEPFSHLDEANIARARELILERVDAEKAGFLLAGLGYDYGFSTDKTLHL
jgi:ABC-type lipoprotein export system ATPase subunit